MRTPGRLPSECPEVCAIRTLMPIDDGSTMEQLVEYPDRAALLRDMRDGTAFVNPFALVEVLVGGRVAARRWPDYVPHGMNMKDWDPKQAELAGLSEAERAAWGRAEMQKLAGELK